MREQLTERQRQLRTSAAEAAVTEMAPKAGSSSMSATPRVTITGPKTYGHVAIGGAPKPYDHSSRGNGAHSRCRTHSSSTPCVRTAELKRCVSEAMNRTPRLPEDSAAKAAVSATAPEADATRTSAATPRATTAEPKRCVNEAIDRGPKLPKGSAAKVTVEATAYR